jgi:hypothetical protein
LFLFLTNWLGMPFVSPRNPYTMGFLAGAAVPGGGKRYQ